MKKYLVLLILLYIYSGLISQESQYKQNKVLFDLKLHRMNIKYKIPHFLPAILLDSIKKGLAEIKLYKIIFEDEKKYESESNQIELQALTKLSPQNRWTKIYHDEISAPKNRMIESYDHGYLLTGRIYHNYPRYNWLIKTDVNGDVLWEKTIGEGINTILLYGMGMNNEGELYLSGSTMIEDPLGYGDPLIIKLNECGEKEWCRIFPSSGHHDYANSLCITPDGGCAAILTRTGETGFIDRVCLTRFNKSGDFQWKQCYNSTAAMDNEICSNLILTPDSGFLMTGFCYYANPGDTAGWLCPYYIKTDSDGNFEWETIAGFNPSNVGGIGWKTVLSPDNNYYYSAISHYYRNGNDAPAILKMDINGDIIGCYDIAIPDEIGAMSEAKFISDSTLIASAAWGPEYNSYPKAVIIDTLGNMLNEQFLLNNEYLATVRTTFDGKLLFYTHAYNDLENQFDAYLFKLNQQLESDTLYTQSFTYDSLCPYQIASDTIVQDNCGLIVGMEEVKPEKTEDQAILIIYPNPAQNKFQVQCFEFQVSSCIIEIFDIYGRKVKEIKTPKGQNTIEVDVGGW
ncbi:MAG: T9SS type A sorting domain-containing protein, partial [Bacteroidales bacterium]|nr:T9SS type A sorting domain-containing protein [Bacteroidales bacterium]